MSLISVGSMAFDAIETPFGKIDKIVGGSAVFIALAASNFIDDIKQVSIIGNDFSQDMLDQLKQRGVSLEGVEMVKDKKSFFWSGRYHEDLNTRDTLITDLNVLEDFNPILPESYRNAQFLMLGNLMPKLQLSVIEQMNERPKLIVLDTMNFWMATQMEDLEKVLQRIDILMVNDAEARELSGQYSLAKAAKSILQMGPRYVIIKKGEHGALLFDTEKVFYAPALPLEDVFDPTGAGDTFAGGFMGYIAKTKDISFENLKRGIIVGSAMASFCVEKFGPTRLQEITISEIEERIKLFKELVSFEIELA